MGKRSPEHLLHYYKSIQKQGSPENSCFELSSRLWLTIDKDALLRKGANGCCQLQQKVVFARSAETHFRECCFNCQARFQNVSGFPEHPARVGPEPVFKLIDGRSEE